MIQFKLNGKPLKIASSWFDLTFDQYVKIMISNGKTPEIISILTSVDLETIIKAKISGLDMVLQAISFLKKPPEFGISATKIGKYDLPLNSKGEFDIQFETLAQFEDMRAVMMLVPEKDMIAHTKAYANYVAIYIQAIRDGEYNPDSAIKMVSEVMQCPANEVIIAGSFFFLKLWTLLTGTSPSSQNTAPKPKKYKQVTKSSIKSSALSHPFRKHR